MKNPVTRMKAKHVRDAGTDMALALGKRWLFESTDMSLTAALSIFELSLDKRAAVVLFLVAKSTALFITKMLAKV